jgi:hypothetical protein
MMTIKEEKGGKEEQGGRQYQRRKKIIVLYHFRVCILSKAITRKNGRLLRDFNLKRLSDEFLIITILINHPT